MMAPNDDWEGDKIILQNRRKCMKTCSEENMGVTYLCHELLKLGKFSTHLHEMQDFQRIPIMIK